MKNAAMLLAALLTSTGCASLRFRLSCKAEPPKSLICSAESVQDPPIAMRGYVSDPKSPHQQATSEYLSLRMP